ncbi:hypothetical protein ACQPUZ_04775 [Clostridium tertium]
MEFITVEQFREQPIEVQKVFLDWWECDYGDLYYYNEDPLEYKDFEIIDNNLECDIEGDFDYFKSLGVIPIFTEGQLRKFIEDKAKCKVMIEYTSCENIVVKICTQDEVTGALRYNRKLTFPNNKFDLINSYWKVACMIAKEEVDG